MSFPNRFALVAAVLLVAGFAAPAARAAQSYDNCTGFIDSLPATITTQGVWCLRKNLTTAIASGNAIKIATNNVTIDCNDYKIGGLAAGTASMAVGIGSDNVLNATVRSCGIRGFYVGTWLFGGGHLVEDNRFDGNLYTAINVQGEDNLVRGNRVFDTGGSTQVTHAMGISVQGDIVDNTVSGVFARLDGLAYGVRANVMGAHVSGNRIRQVLVETGEAYGLHASYSNSAVSGNHVHNDSLTTGRAISTGSGGMCERNQVYGFQSLYYGCPYAAGNLPAL